MSGHTPGPWCYQHSISDTCRLEVVQHTINGECIAGEYGIEREEDARLIAAAPELLAALIAADSYLMGEYFEGPDVCDLVQSAIAKATQP